MDKLVSIVLCTYNRAYCVGRAVESVLAQTYGFWELFVIDDGSTDHTETVMEQYTDPRIHYIKMEKNRFYCYAANYGLDHCQGEYIAFLNSDDAWFSEKLEKQVSFMEQNPQYGACFTEVVLTNNEGKDISEECADMCQLFANRCSGQEEWLQFFLYHGNSLCHPSALIRKYVLDEVGKFNLYYCQLADFDLWVRIVTKYPIEILREPLIYFRWDVKEGDQISSTTRQHMVRTYNEQMLIRRQLVEQLTDEELLRFFKDQFRNPDSSTSLELQFEKAFLLMECIKDTPHMKVLGLEKLEQILREEGAVEVLENHFQQTLQDVYKWDLGHWYWDPILRKDMGDLQNKKEQYQSKSRRLEELIKEYHNSTSWKCTAPFRSLVKVLREKVKGENK